MSNDTEQHEGPYEGDPTRLRGDGSIAAVAARSLTKPKPVEGSPPPRTGKTPPRADAAAEADSSSAVRYRYRSPEVPSAKTLIHSGKEDEDEESTVHTVRVAGTSREKSAALPPPESASSTPSFSSTVDDAVKSERPSLTTVAGTSAVACSNPHSSSAAAPRGRRRAPSSPRGRPSSPGPSSPLRPTASSSPSSCASGSPARRRGSPVPISPRVGGHSMESQVCE